MDVSVYVSCSIKSNQTLFVLDNPHALSKYKTRDDNKKWQQPQYINNLSFINSREGAGRYDKGELKGEKGVSLIGFIFHYCRHERHCNGVPSGTVAVDTIH